MNQEALAATEEAVAVWRTLADDDPDHRPSLARTLSNLESPLGRTVGRHQEALAATEEGVAIWRTLAD